MELALDTSSAISVAVVRDDLVLASVSKYAPRAHAERLASMIHDAMDEAGAKGTDLERIVVGTGPAPFTGLRVGLMTARTLGFAWGVPVAGVCSLDAMGARHGGLATVIADARRREVYWATYRDGLRVEGPHVDLPSEVRVVGDPIGRGISLYPEVFDGGTQQEGLLDPDPAWLVRVVSRLVSAGVTDFPTLPLYLRRPDVHERSRP